MDEAHSDRAHAQYAPSGASRWMNCHGSIAASRGIQEKSSAAAEEGTACHEAASDILDGLPEDEAAFKWDLSDEQIEIVGHYTDFVFKLLDRLRDKFNDDVRVWIEDRVRSSISDKFHGTADCGILAGRTLAVIDLKAGFLPVVPRYPDGKLNPQLASYAICFLDTHGLWSKVDTVKLCIVQPRVYPEPQIITVPVQELADFYDTVSIHIEAIEDGDETRNAGEHCRFCPAKGACTALRRHAVKSAKTVFGGATASDRNYTPDEMEEILDEAEAIQAHIDGIRAHVKREIEKGRTFRNYKLVEKRAVSSWTDWDQAVRDFELNGWEASAIFNLRPKAPNKIAKLLGVPVTDLATYFEKKSSGTTLVRADDKRAPVKVRIFGDDLDNED